MTILYNDDIIKLFNDIFAGNVEGNEYTFVLADGRKVKLLKNKYAGKPTWLEGFVNTRSIDILESTSPYAKGVNEYRVNHDHSHYTVFKLKTLSDGKQVVTCSDDETSHVARHSNGAVGLTVVCAAYKDSECDGSMFINPTNNEDVENAVSLLFNGKDYPKYFEIEVQFMENNTVSVGYNIKTVPNPYLLYYALIPNESSISFQNHLQRVLLGVLRGDIFIDNEHVMQQINTKIATVKENYARLGYNVV